VINGRECNNAFVSDICRIRRAYPAVDPFCPIRKAEKRETPIARRNRERLLHRRTSIQGFHLTAIARTQETRYRCKIDKNRSRCKNCPGNRCGTLSRSEKEDQDAVSGLIRSLASEISARGRTGWTWTGRPLERESNRKFSGVKYIYIYSLSALSSPL